MLVSITWKSRIVYFARLILTSHPFWCLQTSKMSQSLGNDAAQAQTKRAELRSLLKRVPVDQFYQEVAQYTLRYIPAVIFSCVFILEIQWTKPPSSILFSRLLLFPWRWLVPGRGDWGCQDSSDVRIKGHYQQMEAFIHTWFWPCGFTFRHQGKSRNAQTPQGIQRIEIQKNKFEDLLTISARCHTWDFSNLSIWDANSSINHCATTANAIDCDWRSAAGEDTEECARRTCKWSWITPRFVKVIGCENWATKTTQTPRWRFRKTCASTGKPKY